METGTTCRQSCVTCFDFASANRFHVRAGSKTSLPGFIFFALDGFGRLAGLYRRELVLYRAPDLGKKREKTHIQGHF